MVRASLGSHVGKPSSVLGWSCGFKKKERGLRATARSPEWNSRCRYTDVMQHIFNPVIASYKRFSIWAFLGSEGEECVFCIIIFLYMWMAVVDAWPFEQTFNPVSTIGSTWNFSGNWPSGFWRVVKHFYEFIYVYSTGQGKITRAE